MALASDCCQEVISSIVVPAIRVAHCVGVVKFVIATLGGLYRCRSGERHGCRRDVEIMIRCDELVGTLHVDLINIAHIFIVKVCVFLSALHLRRVPFCQWWLDRSMLEVRQSRDLLHRGI